MFSAEYDRITETEDLPKGNNMLDRRLIFCYNSFCDTIRSGYEKKSEAISVFCHFTYLKTERRIIQL